MPKKGKVNKLAKMSDEERMRYLQHRADIEEEARRRKRELVDRFIKNKLDKEQTFSRMNTAKINQVWRYILRKVKCKQMMMDIQGMVGTFNFMVDRKNRLLTALMKAIEDSEDQHRRIFQDHTENISYFLSIGTQRLDKLQSEYEDQKNALLEQWDKEEFAITDGQDRGETHLKLITYIQDRDFRQYTKEKEQERATAVNDSKLEHEEDMHLLRLPKDLEVEHLRARLREIYSAYTDQHNPILNHYRSLKEKDEFYQRDIRKNETLIQQATKILLSLQNEWQRTTSTMTSKLSHMFEHKEELAQRYWQMKKDFKSERVRAEDALVSLVDVSQGTVEKLEEAKKKLHKIHQMANICSKYESEADRAVLNAVDEDDRMLDFENLDEAMIKECKEYSKMDKFLLKVNHVKVQTMCLKAEKAKLAKENVQLKVHIKRYLTELALKNERQRPQSMKIQSETKLEAGKVQRPVTCIEGALSNAVLHEKRMKIIDKRNREMGTIRAYPRFQNWMQAQY